MHLLTVGFARDAGSDEPIRTLSPVIKAFHIDAIKLRTALLRPLPLANLRNQEARHIWANLARKPARWDELKKKLHRLQQLGPLPSFKIATQAVSIEVLPEDATVNIASNEYAVLRALRSLFEKEPRMGAYGSTAAVSLILLAPLAPPVRREKAGRQKSAAKA